MYSHDQNLSWYRKQNKEIIKALKNEDNKLARKLEIKKLEVLLEQVSVNNPDDDSD